MSALDRLKDHLTKPFDENAPKDPSYVSGYNLYKEAMLERLMDIFKVESKQALMDKFYLQFNSYPKEIVDKMVDDLIDPRNVEQQIQL